MNTDETAIRLERAIEKLNNRIKELEHITDDQKTDIWRLEDRVSNLEREVSSLQNEVRYK
jgi:prefoldin subunit 5